jgi:hypothetical protein
MLGGVLVPFFGPLFFLARLRSCRKGPDERAKWVAFLFREERERARYAILLSSLNSFLIQSQVDGVIHKFPRLVIWYESISYIKARHSHQEEHS